METGQDNWQGRFREGKESQTCVYTAGRSDQDSQQEIGRDTAEHEPSCHGYNGTGGREESHSLWDREGGSHHEVD